MPEKGKIKGKEEKMYSYIEWWIFQKYSYIEWFYDKILVSGQIILISNIIRISNILISKVDCIGYTILVRNVTETKERLP